MNTGACSRKKQSRWEARPLGGGESAVRREEGEEHAQARGKEARPLQSHRNDKTEKHVQRPRQAPSGLNSWRSFGHSPVRRQSQQPAEWRAGV